MSGGTGCAGPGLLTMLPAPSDWTLAWPTGVRNSGRHQRQRRRGALALIVRLLAPGDLLRAERHRVVAGRQRHRAVERDAVGRLPEVARRAGTTRRRSPRSRPSAIRRGGDDVAVGAASWLSPGWGMCSTCSVPAFADRVGHLRLRVAGREIVAHAGLLAVGAQHVHDVLVVELARRAEDVAALGEVGHRRRGLRLPDAEATLLVIPGEGAAHAEGALDVLGDALARVDGEEGKRLRPQSAAGSPR